MPENYDLENRKLEYLSKDEYRKRLMDKQYEKIIKAFWGDDYDFMQSESATVVHITSEEVNKRLIVLYKEFEIGMLNDLKELLVKLTLEYAEKYSGRDNAEQRKAESDINLIQRTIKIIKK